MARSYGLVGLLGLAGVLALTVPVEASAGQSGQPDDSGDTDLVPAPGDDVGTADASGDADTNASFDSSMDAGFDDSGTADMDGESTTASSGSGSARFDDDASPTGGNSDNNVGADSGIRPFKGRFGLGAIRTLAGLNGINFRYFITDQFAIGGNFGVATFTYKENDPASTDVCPGADCTLENTRTVAALGGSIEALYFAKIGRAAGRLPFRADFGLGGRFGLMGRINDQDIEDNLDDPTELHIELPLVVQLMFGENFALAPEFGVDFRIVPGKREDGDSNPGTGNASSVNPGSPNGPGFGFNLGSGVGIFGGASMHYYF